MKLFLLSSLSLILATSLPAVPLSATIVKAANDETFSCYIISVDKANIKYSLSENGSGAALISRKDIKDIGIRPPEGWEDAQNGFLRGQYELVLPEIAKFADEYEGLTALENSIGSLARFYHFVCLIKTGRFRELVPVYEKAQYNPPELSDAFDAQLSILPAWVEAGKGNWPGTEAAVRKFEEKSATGGYSGPPFQKGLPNEIASQLSMLRAVAHDQQGRQIEALTDYGRAMTLDVGANAWITRSSLGASLRILHGMLAAAETPDPALQLEAHCIAVILRDQYGIEAVPKEQQIHFNKPKADGSAPKVEAPAEGTEPAKEADPAAAAPAPAPAKP
jgi:hypothetical protein